MGAYGSDTVHMGVTTPWWFTYPKSRLLNQQIWELYQVSTGSFECSAHMALGTILRLYHLWEFEVISYLKQLGVSIHSAITTMLWRTTKPPQPAVNIIHYC